MKLIVVIILCSLLLFSWSSACDMSGGPGNNAGGDAVLEYDASVLEAEDTLLEHHKAPLPIVVPPTKVNVTAGHEIEITPTSKTKKTLLVAVDANKNSTLVRRCETVHYYCYVNCQQHFNMPTCNKDDNIYAMAVPKYLHEERCVLPRLLEGNQPGTGCYMRPCGCNIYEDYFTSTKGASSYNSAFSAVQGQCHDWCTTGKKPKGVIDKKEFKKKIAHKSVADMYFLDRFVRYGSLYTYQWRMIHQHAMDRIKKKKNPWKGRHWAYVLVKAFGPFGYKFMKQVTAIYHMKPAQARKAIAMLTREVHKAMRKDARKISQMKKNEIKFWKHQAYLRKHHYQLKRNKAYWNRMKKLQKSKHWMKKDGKDEKRRKSHGKKKHEKKKPEKRRGKKYEKRRKSHGKKKPEKRRGKKYEKRRKSHGRKNPVHHRLKLSIHRKMVRKNKPHRRQSNIHRRKVVHRTVRRSHASSTRARRYVYHPPVRRYVYHPPVRRYVYHPPVRRYVYHPPVRRYVYHPPVRRYVNHTPGRR